MEGQNMETETGFVETNNTRLYYELAGQGQPLVMVHAGVADSRQWNSEFSHFSPDFQVLRYDLRGYGKSQPVAGEFSHLRDLKSLLDQKGFEQPLVLVGCSMGGTLAMDFTLAYPHKVKGLVMLGAGPSGLRMEVPAHPQAAATEEAYKAGDLDRVAELEAQIWFDGMGRKASQVNPIMRTLALEMNRLALAYDALQLGKRLPDTDTPAAERLDELKIPVLVIVGEHDIPYLQAAADYMLEHIVTSRKVILKDAAHLANLEHPKQFQSTIREFLVELSGQTLE
jgi:pimeloyl-ACP methyl ester carboxylesterase